jgi:hypothetical protein
VKWHQKGISEKCVKMEMNWTLNLNRTGILEDLKEDGRTIIQGVLGRINHLLSFDMKMAILPGNHRVGQRDR